MEKKITKQLLDLYDKYDGDFGLLDEPWALKKDKLLFCAQAAQILCEYIDQLNVFSIENISLKLKGETAKRLSVLEEDIDNEVISILRHRIV